MTWPRRVLIERAARRCCERLLTSWTGKGGDYLTEPVRVWLEEQWVARRLTPEFVRDRLCESCPGLEGEWDSAVRTVISKYEAACSAQGLETAELVTAMEEIGAIVGTPDLEGRAR